MEYYWDIMKYWWNIHGYTCCENNNLWTGKSPYYSYVNQQFLSGHGMASAATLIYLRVRRTWAYTRKKMGDFTIKHIQTGWKHEMHCSGEMPSSSNSSIGAFNRILHGIAECTITSTYKIIKNHGFPTSFGALYPRAYKVYQLLWARHAVFVPKGFLQGGDSRP